MRTVAIVGAGGAIGQALCILLAGEVGRLILIGNPEHPEESNRRLVKVAGSIAASVDQLRRKSRIAQGSVAGWLGELGLAQLPTSHRIDLTNLGQEVITRTPSVLISTDAAAVLPQADIVVCCTSSTERLINEDSLNQSAVVCDVSRPSNVSAELGIRRPDVMVLNGGVIRLPGGSSLGFNASLPPGHAYACMAETMMLAMDQRYHDISLGFDLQLSTIFEIEQLAKELDFQIVLDKRERSCGPHDHDLSSAIVESVDFRTMHA